MVSQAQRWVGSGVSMGRNRRTSNTLQLRAFNLKCLQSTKNLTPEGAAKATETLNSSKISNQIFETRIEKRTLETSANLVRGFLLTKGDVTQAFDDAKKADCRRKPDQIWLHDFSSLERILVLYRELRQ